MEEVRVKKCSFFLKKFFLLSLTVIVISCMVEITEMKSYAAGYGTVVETGKWSAADGVSDVTWTVYDSGADGDVGVTTADTVVISGTGVMGAADQNLGTLFPWRAYRTTITKVIVEEGITIIETNAFATCINLTSVSLPSTLTKIGTSAFYRCSSLESIVIPEKVEKIMNGTFSECTNLKNINIPKNTQLDNGTFSECTSLESIDLSENTKNTTLISTFKNCTSLKEVKLPLELEKLVNPVFGNCTSLEKMYIPAKVNYVENDVFSGVSTNIKFYLESSEHLGTVTDLGGSGVAPILPYSISYTKDDTEEVIAEVYADGMQSYTIQDGDLPDTVGVWRDTSYNNGQGRNVTVGTKFENISGDIELQLIPGTLIAHPQDTTVSYGDTTKKDLSVTVKVDVGITVAYQWQVAMVTSGRVGTYTDISGATSATYSVPDGKNVGSYSYRCVVNIGGYTFTSNAATVTVNQADGAIANKNYRISYEYNKNAIEEPTASNFTYANTTKTPVFTWYKGDYTNTSVSASDKIPSAPTEEGTYTLVVAVAGDTNYAAGELKLLVKILEHNHVNTEVRNKEEASCTQEGYTGDTYCKDCDKKLSSGQTVGVKVHNYESEVTKTPTTTEAGIRTYTCTECGDNYTESIDKIVENKPTDNNSATQNNQPTQNNSVEDKPNTNKETAKEETPTIEEKIEETEDEAIVDVEDTNVSEDESKQDEAVEEKTDVDSEEATETGSGKTIEEGRKNFKGIIVGAIVSIAVMSTGLCVYFCIKFKSKK